MICQVKDGKGRVCVLIFKSGGKGVVQLCKEGKLAAASSVFFKSPRDCFGATCML